MPFISVPLKAAETVDLVGPISKYLKQEYKDEANLDAIAQFAELRESCVVRSPEKHDSGLRVLQRYFLAMSRSLFNHVVTVC